MRPAPTRTSRPAAALLAVLALLLLVAGGAASPAAAATVRDVRITQDGPVPRQLTITAGDSVRFVNADSFVHRAVSDSEGWAFDTGTLAPGQTFTVQPALERAGTYAYRGAGLDDFRGTVVVPGAATTRSPSAAPRPSSAAPVVPVAPSPSAAPAPAASASASPASASASPSPAPPATGGTGRAFGPPPLAGSSFGGFDGLAPTPAPGGPAPLVAPDLPFDAAAPLPVATPDPLLPAAADAPASAPAQALDLPALSSPVEARRFGLPLALAAVALAGVTSLLVRLLLAEAPADGGPATA